MQFPRQASNAALGFPCNPCKRLQLCSRGSCTASSKSVHPGSTVQTMKRLNVALSHRKYQASRRQTLL